MTLPPSALMAIKSSSVMSDSSLCLPGQLDRWLAARHDDLVGVRRHIHMHPELSHHEFETAAYVTRLLTAAGLRPGQRVRLRTEDGRTIIVPDGGETAAGVSLPPEVAMHVFAAEV
jgi:hypothetical protein